MVFAHDTELSLQAAVAWANSGLEPDTLTSLDDLRGLYEEWQYSGHPRLTHADLDAVREIRPRLHELLTADRDAAVDLVNTILREFGALPQLRRHDQHDWHIHAEPDDSTLATQILVETAMAMTDVIRADEMSRFGVCADDDCEGIVLDLSRNRSRRFCSVACGNRNAVAAYRARQARA